MPGAQAVHPVVPLIRALYLPATQAVHADDVVAEVVSAATCEYVPGAHAVQLEVPVDSAL